MAFMYGFSGCLGVGKGSLKMYRKRWLRCARFQAALSGGIFGSLKANPSGKKPFGATPNGFLIFRLPIPPRARG